MGYRLQIGLNGNSVTPQFIAGGSGHYRLLPSPPR
jgi:hypothetical protein